MLISISIFNNFNFMSKPRAKPVSTAAAEIAVSTAVAAAVAVKINRGWGKNDFRNPVVFATTRQRIIA